MLVRVTAGDTKCIMPAALVDVLREPELSLF